LPGIAQTPERFEFLLRELRRREGRPCLLRGDRRVRYGELEDLRRVWGCRLREAGARPGEVVGLESHWSFDAIASLLAILAKGSTAALVVPGDPHADDFLRRLGAVRGFRRAHAGAWSLEERLPPVGHDAAPGAAVVFPGPDPEASPPRALAIDALLAEVGPGRAERSTPGAPFARPEGIRLLFATLVGGGCLVLPADDAPPAAAPAPTPDESGSWERR